MRTLRSESHAPLGGGTGPADRGTSDSTPADAEPRDRTAPNGNQPTGSPDQPAEEKLSREEMRKEQDRARSVRKEGLDSLQPTFGFGGATSFGGYAAGRDITINLGAVSRTSPMGPLAADVRAMLSEVYVRFPGYAEARNRLLTTHVLVLLGDEGSGRRASALALLDNLVDGQIYLLGSEHELKSLLSEDRDADQCGYLLDSVAGPAIVALTQSVLSSVEHWLVKKNSFLVITATARGEAQYDDLNRYLFDHEVPDPHQVLDNHLRQRCPEFPGHLTAWLDGLRLSRHVTAATQPGAMEELAAMLARAVTEERSLDEALEYWIQWRASVHAKRLLRSTRQLDPELRPTEQLQRCAFLVALVVFNDAPYLPVAAAAESLAQSLTAAEYPKGTPHRQIFALRRGDCLKWLRGTVTPRCRSDWWGEQHTEHIQFDDEYLPSVLLHELWHEYDAVRTPVLRWLGDLAVSRNPDIRVRAAQAVGKLATYDFDYVYEEVIFGWAGSRGYRQRYAAAWALEAAVRTSNLGGLVLRLLREWCRSGSGYRKLTAVTAYGTAIGAGRSEEALRSLRDLARANDPEMTRVACDSVVELFLGGQSDQVLDTLQGWLADEDAMTRRFSVESFVQIAYKQDNSGRPVLLSLCGKDHPRSGLLLRLWQHGLAEDYARADAWEVLGRWCRAADQNSDLREFFYHLVGKLESADGRLPVRFRWYFKFWANYAKTPSSTAAQLYAAREE